MNGDFFRGKTAAISGASSGLGALLSLELASRGVKNLILFARRRDKLLEVATRCEQKNAAVAVVAGDVAHPADCEKFAQAAQRQSGEGADFLIHCAGLSMWAKFSDVADVGVFRRIMEVNYLGLCNCLHFFLPQLRARRGMVTAISSIQGKIGVPLHSGYCASKHAIEGLLASLRLEVGDEVAVMSVLPHWIRGTDLRANAAVGAAQRKHGTDAIDAAKCAAIIADAMPKKPRELYIPAKLRALVALAAIRPSLADAVVARAVGMENNRGRQKKD